MTNYLQKHLPWQLLMLAIFWLSSIPNDRFPKIEFDWADKIVHFITFGILGILLYRSFISVRLNHIKDNAMLYSMFIGSLYGLSDEIHQYFVPGRFASVSDWVADTLGVCVFIIIYKLLRVYFERGTDPV